MRIVIACALLGLRLEEKRAIDHDALAGPKTEENLDLTAEITASSDAPNLEVIRVSRQEDAPLVSNASFRSPGR